MGIAERFDRYDDIINLKTKGIWNVKWEYWRKKHTQTKCKILILKTQGLRTPNLRSITVFGVGHQPTRGSFWSYNKSFGKMI